MVSDATPLVGLPFLETLYLSCTPLKDVLYLLHFSANLQSLVLTFQIVHGIIQYKYKTAGVDARRIPSAADVVPEHDQDLRFVSIERLH